MTTTLDQTVQNKSDHLAVISNLYIEGSFDADTNVEIVECDPRFNGWIELNAKLAVKTLLDKGDYNLPPLIHFLAYCVGWWEAAQHRCDVAPNRAADEAYVLAVLAYVETAEQQT